MDSIVKYQIPSTKLQVSVFSVQVPVYMAVFPDT